MRRILASTLALAGLCTLYSIASAAPFTNGSFEVGPDIPGNFIAVPSGSTAIDGWTVGSGDIDYVSSSLWNASDGERSIDLNQVSPGAISQTFDTVAGQQYSVTFDLAANPAGEPLVKPMEVSADGESQVYTYDIGAVDPGPAPYTLDYVTETFSFTATGDSSTLAFTSLTDPESSYGAVIDNVQVTAQAVPEPGTWLLLGMGITGLAAWRRNSASA